MVEAQNRLVKFQEGEYRIVSEAVPQPGPGQALVRVHYSTVNPIDKILYYINKNEGNVLGTDGSGVIEQVGEGVSAELVGKKVAFFGAAYANYRVADVHSLAVLHDSQDLRQAANAIVNPLTAIGQQELVRKKGAKAIINLAGASQLSKQLNKLLNQEGVDFLNIVRKEEQVKILREELGAKYVYNSSDPSFLELLKNDIQTLNPTILFEYVGGSVPG